MLKVRDFSKLYFTFLFLHLASIYQPESRVLYQLSKPLLLASLLFFFIYRTEKSTASKWWISAALFFSLAGDTLLMGAGEIFFLAGMGAFALAHLSYISFFVRERGYPSSWIGLLIGVIIAVFSLFALNTWIELPEPMIIPVNVYGIILGLNFIVSLQFGLSCNKPAYLVPLGVFLFIASDFLLSYQKFNLVGGDTYLQMIIMALYGGAQYLIVMGTLNTIEGKRFSAKTA